MSILSGAASLFTGNPLPLILGGIKKGVGGIFSWLGSLNPWQLACVALSIFALVQHFELVSAHHHSAKVERAAAETKKIDQEKIDRMTAEINSFAKQSAAKQAATRIIVKRGQDHIVVVDKQAQQIEHAPLAGNCKSSALTMGADL